MDLAAFVFDRYYFNAGSYFGSKVLESQLIIISPKTQILVSR